MGDRDQTLRSRQKLKSCLLGKKAAHQWVWSSGTSWDAQAQLGVRHWNVSCEDNAEQVKQEFRDCVLMCPEWDPGERGGGRTEAEVQLCRMLASGDINMCTEGLGSKYHREMEEKHEILNIVKPNPPL